MTEQTTTAPAPEAAAAPTPAVEAQPEPAALPAPAEPAGPPSPPPGFGGRTDAHTGMSLGLAPPGLGSSRQLADDSAPDSLLRRGEGAPTITQQQRVGGPAPKPKEHPFKQLMREAAEKRKAAAAAAAAPAPAPEREVVEAELVEDDAPSSSVA